MVAAHKTPGPANARRCFIRVGTKPWSEIWIDGKNTKLHTPYVNDVACGEHTLTFKRADLHLVKTFRVTAVAGDTLTQSFSLKQAPNGFIKVVLDGKTLTASQYSVSGNTVTGTSIFAKRS